MASARAWSLRRDGTLRRGSALLRHGARFHPEFCCVRVRVIALRLLYGARFPAEIHTLEDAIGFHAFAPLEALACV